MPEVFEELCRCWNKLSLVRIFISCKCPVKPEQIIEKENIGRSKVRDSNGINAAIIGEVSRENSGKVIMKSRIGGKRVVNYLTGEQLPRIC